MENPCKSATWNLLELPSLLWLSEKTIRLYRKVLSHVSHPFFHKRTKPVGFGLLALTSVTGLIIGVIGFAADLRELGVPVPSFSDADTPTSAEGTDSTEPANREISEPRLSCSLESENGEIIPSLVPVNIGSFPYKAVNAVVTNIPAEELNREGVPVEVRCGAVWKKSILQKTDGECRISYPASCIDKRGG